MLDVHAFTNVFESVLIASTIFFIRKRKVEEKGFVNVAWFSSDTKSFIGG